MVKTRNGADQLYEDIFHSSLENILVTDVQGNILMANRQYLASLNYNESEVVGKSLKQFIRTANGKQNTLEKIWQKLSSKELWHGDLFLIGKDSLHPLTVDIKPVQSSAPSTGIRYLFSARNLSPPGAKGEHQGLEYHDQLTLLPNRFLFKKKLEYALEQAKRYRFTIGLLYIDIDNFKYINKSCGYLAGDELLKQVGRRLDSTARKSDIIGYFGGDEFGVALINIALPRLAATAANRFLVEISQPFTVNQEQFNLGASIGISVFPADGKDYDSLVNSAETAMHDLKQQPEPENSYRFFQQEMNVDSSIRLRLESDLRKALDNGEFELFFQPIIDLGSHRIIALETLLRWRNPQRGLVAPKQFIPIAEELGLIIPIGQWVLHSACRQLRSWQTLGIGPLEISVNLSQIQFRDERLLDKIRSILGETGVDPKLLQIEITESSITENTRVAVEVLKGLKEQGVKIAIDDFGTGTSSLGTLKNLPVDTLKLDKSFIRSLPENSDDQAIVQAILSLGKILDLKIIAEGIETREQLEFLQDTECNAYQGFYFSHPLPSEEIFELLHTHTHRTQYQKTRGA